MASGPAAHPDKDARLAEARALCALARQVAGACELATQVKILDQVRESVIIMDLNGYITGWNKSAETLFGYRADEAIGRHILFLYADPAADDESDGFADILREHGGRELEVRRRRKSGEVFWASLQLSLTRDDQGEPVAIVGYLTDITDRIEAEKNLRLQASIFEHSDESIMITGPDRRILSVNPAFTRMTGYTAEEAVGRLPHFLRSARHPLHFYEEIWQHVERDGGWHGEVWTRRKSGEDFPSWASLSLVRNRDGRICNYFSIFTDISERKRAEERIHHLAYYDSLTGLPNRALLFKLVDQALAAARRNRRHGALLFIDLNRFKTINDTLGHSVGDRLLQQVAERLRNVVRAEDVVARLGGDEFVVALFDIARREHAAMVAQKLIAALETPFLLDGRELTIGAAIGISLYPRDGLDAETLLRMADIAMYRCKESGREGYAFYSQEMNQRALERLRIETGLRRGIERNELTLHYQPKVDLTSGRILGAEALVRWQHPDLGLMPPAAFIPIAEESGLVMRLSSWVLEAALGQLRRWAARGWRDYTLAINLSARDFSHTLADRFTSLLAHHAVDPRQIELEITEGMLAHSSDDVIAMMQRLAGAGISLLLDDFGTGYSSLLYLKRFPISALKIDRQFVAGIPADGSDCAIAGAIISMAQRLGHRVIAEGVETREQAEFLKTLGCREAQGHYYAEPMTADQFEALLAAGGVLRVH